MLSYRHPSPGASAVQESLGSSLCSAQWTQYHKACERRKRNGPILHFKAFTNLYDDMKKKKKKKKKHHHQQQQQQQKWNFNTCLPRISIQRMIEGWMMEMASFEATF